MSEKKYAATPHRRQEARRKGQVFKSQELNAAILLLTFVGLLKFWFPQLVMHLQQVFYYTWQSDWISAGISRLMLNLTWLGLQIMLPIFAVGLVVPTASNYLQVRSVINVENVKPQLSRISLIGGAKRMFGLRAWVELLKSLLKVGLIGYFLYATVKDNLQVFPALGQLTVGQSAILLGSTIQGLAWKIAVSFLVLAAADYSYQWWDYERNLRMTQEELKQEHKQTEGNPEVKMAIKKRQRALGMRRMMQDLKKADVVVTNPTHFAVAIRYNLKERSAPYVVAKGQDQVAQKIKEIARENGIVIMENKPLARTLYHQTEIGQVVPPELYKAVAEVLAFVYRLKKKKV